MRLTSSLQMQIEKENLQGEVVVLIEADRGEKTIGAKRNLLLDKARKLGSVAIAFVDDDDLVGPTYVKRNVEGIKLGFDCCSLAGQIYFGRQKGKPFLHSLKYSEWSEDAQYYYRCPNHLNAIRLDKICDTPFEEINFGEDGKWSMALKECGELKTEYEIKEVIYHYFTGAKDIEWSSKYYQNFIQ